MATHKVNSSPMVLIIPLVIAAIVVIGAALISKNSNEVRSKADWDPLKRCTVACRNTNMFKETGACSLDCPLVVNGTMTCTAFCQENVKERRGEGSATTYMYDSQIRTCNNQCANWYGTGANPTP